VPIFEEQEKVTYDGDISDKTGVQSCPDKLVSLFVVKKEDTEEQDPRHIQCFLGSAIYPLEETA
jgi:hypothetical protein